jgi:hypothetical protein
VECAYSLIDRPPGPPLNQLKSPWTNKMCEGDPKSDEKRRIDWPGVNQKGRWGFYEGKPGRKGDSSMVQPTFYPKKINIEIRNLKMEGNEAAYPNEKLCLVEAFLLSLRIDLEEPNYMILFTGERRKCPVLMAWSGFFSRNPAIPLPHPAKLRRGHRVSIPQL